MEAPPRPEDRVGHVVVLVHGIRTYAPWQNIVRAELERAGLTVELTNYGYFDVLRFWLPVKTIRQSSYRRVWISIRDIRRRYPNAKISFLAHSFGTYVVANILRYEFDFKAHRIVLCGTVLRHDFPFYEVTERFSSPIMNDVGLKDYWPALAESLTWGYGSAGTYGFRNPRIRDRWHKNINHRGFFSKGFCAKFWVPFFVEGTIVDTQNTFVNPPVYIRLIQKIKIANMALFFILSYTVVSSVSALINDPTAVAVIYGQEEHLEGTVRWTSPLSLLELGDPEERVIQIHAEVPNSAFVLLDVFPNPRRTPRPDAVYRLLKCSEGQTAYCVELPAQVKGSHFVRLEIVLAGQLRKTIGAVPTVELRQTPRGKGFGLMREKEEEAKPTDAQWTSMRTSGIYEFVYVLSNDHETLNIETLTGFAFVAVVVKFTDGSVEEIVLEKGVEGDRIVRETVQGWGSRYQY